MDYVGGKHNRMLSLYNKLLDGDEVNVNSAAEKFEVSTKTIKRDIEDIRYFLYEKCLDTGEQKEVVYDRSTNTYRITGNDKLTNSEILAVCKVLLESRSFVKSEIMPILDKMVKCCAFEKKAKMIEELIANEKHHYIEPHHQTAFIDKLWDVGMAVKEQFLMEIEYIRLKDKAIVKRIIQPVGIMFSEYYFYLTAFIADIDKEGRFENKDDIFPTIYRIDRIQKFKILDKRFAIPYKDRFEEGEFRKRVQFMFGGKLEKIKFKYKGLSVESVLDRLPTAKVLYEKDDVYTISAEVFGKGIDMWLRSQGESVELIKD